MIPQVFITADMLAIKKPSFKVRKSEEVRIAEFTLSRAVDKWRKAGRPTEPSNEIFINKKKLKSEYRKAISSEKLKDSIKDNNDMMEAKFKDMKGFSKMVNKKRNNPRGDTGLLIIGEQQFSGDAQVLSGFFEYHKAAQTAPILTNDESDHLYKSATIDISSIQYIIRSRGWKLPSLSTSQVAEIISRLKSGKSPDYFGLTSDHVKNGGSEAILYITNIST